MVPGSNILTDFSSNCLIPVHLGSVVLGPLKHSNWCFLKVRWYQRVNSVTSYTEKPVSSSFLWSEILNLTLVCIIWEKVCYLSLYFIRVPAEICYFLGVSFGSASMFLDMSGMSIWNLDGVCCESLEVMYVIWDSKYEIKGYWELEVCRWAIELILKHYYKEHSVTHTFINYANTLMFLIVFLLLLFLKATFSFLGYRFSSGTYNISPYHSYVVLPLR